MRRVDSLENTWCWEGLGAGREGDDRGWDGWMASLTQWTWVWVNSGSWWWTREAWRAAIHAKSQTRLSGWTELISYLLSLWLVLFFSLMQKLKLLIYILLLYYRYLKILKCIQILLWRHVQILICCHVMFSYIEYFLSIFYLSFLLYPMKSISSVLFNLYILGIFR